MAGEFANNLYNLDSLVAVAPPANLKDSAHRLLEEGPLFNRYFISALRKEALRREKFHHNKNSLEIPRTSSIIDFDHHYLAPRTGFKSAYDYYKKASAEPFLKNIDVPSLLLHAEDDPIVDGTYLERFEAPSHWDIVVTPKGGHVGFLDSKDIINNFRWMDSTITDWLDFHFH